MSYCSIEDAFKDPFLKNRRKKKRNTPSQNIVEGFECLDGSDQLELSTEHQLKGSLSKHNQGNKLNVNVRLDKSNQMNRPDEQTYYPDMSLESEYALITDVKNSQGQAYRPAHPFTKPSNKQPDDLVINSGMYESFNETDNLMSVEHDTIRDKLSTPQNVARNEMIYSGNMPINNDIYSNVSSDNTIVKQNKTQSSQPMSEDKFQLLLQNYMELQSKIDEILKKVNKMESEPDNKENIHDIILFAIFGVFFIYVLDSIYRIGKKSI